MSSNKDDINGDDISFNNNNNIYINNIEHYNQYINIGTQNVKGFNKIEKRNYFFTIYNNDFNLDIIGLTETKLKKTEDKFMSLPNKLDDKIYFERYQTWWSGSNDHFMGAGVGLAISKVLAKHVINIEKIEGRAIKADLQFKRKTKLSIIVVYIHASEEDAEARTILVKKIQLWIDKEIRQNSHVIIMGDFNADPDIFEEKFKFQQRKIKAKYHIIQMLKNKNLLDLHKVVSISNIPAKI